MRTWPVSNKMIEELEAGPHVVLVGSNPADGFIVYGPFPNWRDATNWCNTVCDGNGWAQPLEPPHDG